MKYNDIGEVVKDLEENPVEKSGHIYHPIPYPEFSHLTTSTDSQTAMDKLGLVESFLKQIYPEGLAGKKLIDIGANCGLYSFSLAEKGMDVMSFEPHLRYSEIGQYIAQEKDASVDWRPHQFRPEEIKGRYFDLCLMLSVFQWMAAGGERMREASSHLKYLSRHARYMIFEIGYNDGKSCLKTRKLNHYSELNRFLLQNTEYKHFKLLGKTSAWGRGVPRYMVLCSNDSSQDDNLIRRLTRSVRV